jgi:hypothetical protein
MSAIQEPPVCNSLPKCPQPSFPTPSRILCGVPADELLYFIPAGDSFNEVAMLDEMHVSFLFHAPHAVEQQFPRFEGYAGLMKLIQSGGLRTRLDLFVTIY